MLPSARAEVRRTRDVVGDGLWVATLTHPALAAEAMARW